MRKLVCLTVALAALVLGAGYCCLPDDPISQATRDKIKKGMTETEVVRIVGRKCDGSHSFETSDGFSMSQRWYGENGCIVAILVRQLDEDESHVADAEFQPSRLPWWEGMWKRLARDGP